MINDYISIESANVIDLGVLINIILDNTQNQGAVISSIVNEISNFFSSGNRQMGQNVTNQKIYFGKYFQSELLNNYFEF